MSEQEIIFKARNLIGDCMLNDTTEQQVNALKANGYPVKLFGKILGIKQSKVNKILNIKPKPYKKPSKEKKFEANFKQKVKRFQSRSVVNTPYSDKDVLDFIKSNPYCYISQDKIDIYDLSSYAFDHYIPVSKGGSSDLENLRICKSMYNIMKWDMLFNDFVNHCKKVVEVHG